MDRMKALDRWTVVEVVGTAFLVGGVWAKWGPAWASMLFGAMLLAVATIAARQGGG
jgi:hypothetical protein